MKDIIQFNVPFLLRVIYAGGGIYNIMFTYQETTLFQPLSYDEYVKYRKLSYLRPAAANNYLLDLVNFENTPYQRQEFKVMGKDDGPTKEMIQLWEDIKKMLEQ